MSTPRHATLIAALCIVAACSSGGSSTDSSLTTLAPTQAPATTEATTTTATAPSTTTPPAPTTTEALPVPIQAPAAGVTEPEKIIGTIEIPAIGVKKNLYEGITLGTLDKGPGYWPGTALPGHLGNTVVAGHRTSHDKPFRNIDKLKVGDEIIYNTADGRFVYKVTKTQIVTPDAVWILNQSRYRTTTLFACHPPGSTRQRIVVFASLA